MIEYVNSLKIEQIKILMVLKVGESSSVQKHIKLLENSSYIWLAVDNATGKVIGFINAISDRTLCAYIPLLEVLSEYRGQGVGSKLYSLCWIL